MTIYEALKSTGLPCAYSHFRKPQEPPFVVYLGNGQRTKAADDTFIWRENMYVVEYYFKVKDAAAEAEIEEALLTAGYQYEKSPDAYIEDQDLFVIYYYV